MNKTERIKACHAVADEFHRAGQQAEPGHVAARMEAAGAEAARLLLLALEAGAMPEFREAVPWPHQRVVDPDDKRIPPAMEPKPVQDIAFGPLDAQWWEQRAVPWIARHFEGFTPRAATYHRDLAATPEDRQDEAMGLLRAMADTHAQAMRVVADAQQNEGDDEDRAVNLEPRHKALALVRQHPHWTYKQIAEKVGVHPGTVKKWSEIKALKRASRGYDPPPRGYRKDSGDIEAESW